MKACPVPQLYDEHLNDLHASGLSDKTIDAMEVYSLKSQLVVGMPDVIAMRIDSALIFPYFDQAGHKNNFIRAKLFPPFIGKSGTQKYWQAPKTPPHLYILPSVNGALQDPDKKLYIVEGEKKTAKAVESGLNAIGLGGLWNWKEKSSGLIKEFDRINMKNREVTIVPDSDTFTRDDHNLRLAIYLLSRELESRGAKISVVGIPA